jgi:hypothetical protein
VDELLAGDDHLQQQAGNDQGNSCVDQREAVSVAAQWTVAASSRPETCTACALLFELS